MKYKCKVEGCNFETDDRHGVGGHAKKHVRRGELARKVIKKTEPPQLQPQLPTPTEIATALLNTAVDAINKEQSLQEQLKVAKAKIHSLDEALTKTMGERDRVVRLHNEQVKIANKHGTELPSTETLIKAAKLR